ncbi:MAG: hypothetical protein Tsb005_13510 [Gammaproteobacteria bacterium]
MLNIIKHNRWIIYLVLLLLVVLTIITNSYLYHNSKINIKAIEAAENVLNTYAKNDLKLNRDILHVTFQRLPHYDKVNAYITAQKHLYNRLQVIGKEFPSTQQDIMRLHELQTQKIQHIEQLKMNNATFKNSLNFLSSIIQFRRLKEDNTHSKSYYDLIINLLLYTQSEEAELEKLLLIRIEKLKRDSELQANTYLLRHADIIINNKKKLQNIMNTIFNLPSDQIITRVYMSFQQKLETAIKRAEIYSNFLLGSVITFGLMLMTAIVILALRTRALVGAKLKLELANQVKADFLSNMRHELRTPLNTIIGGSEIIMEDVENPTLKNFASRIHRCGKRLLTLINDMLILAQVQRDNMELNWQPVLLSEICEFIKEAAEPEAAKNGNLEFKQSLQHDINNHNFRSAMNEITATSWFFFRTAI